MRRFAAWVVLTAIGVAIGFGLALLASFAINAILPPFRRSDDDTWREFGPVLIAYGVWGTTSLIGAVLAWRWVRNRYAER